MAISCDRFWFGDGPEDINKGWIEQDFNGMGFQGFARKCGLGVSMPEPLHSAAGAAQYLSKGCIAYFSKGSQEKHPHLVHNSSDDNVALEHWDKKTKGDMGDVDWNASQRGVMIANAVYGSLRHRGKNGTAYGCSLKTKDASIMPAYSTDTVEDIFAGGMAGALYPTEARQS